MRNHGAVCVGKDATEAITRIAALESECASFFLARLAAQSGELDGSIRDLVIQALLPMVDNAITRFEDAIQPESRKAP